MLADLEKKLCLLDNVLTTELRQPFVDVYYHGLWVFVIEQHDDKFGITHTGSDNMGFGLTSPINGLILMKKLLTILKPYWECKS
jgi:hypothetical protein